MMDLHKLLIFVVCCLISISHHVTEATEAMESNCTKLKFLSLQEIQSPPGSNHSNGILQTNPAGSIDAGTSVGLIYFSNPLVRPNANGTAGTFTLGTQTGHCVQVNADNLACYFNFDLKSSRFGKGRILLEALFHLPVFPLAEFVVHGGSGAFFGIIGFGSTSAVKYRNGTVADGRINYNINFCIRK
jgi:hypothetical protein